MILRRPLFLRFNDVDHIGNRCGYSEIKLYCGEMDLCPEWVQILDLLQSIAPDPQQIVIRTALTCDTINPWGTADAELERYTGRIHEGK